MMTVGQQVRAARKRSNQSLRAAAKKIGVSFVLLCNIENDHANTTVGTLQKIAAEYRITIRIGANP